jgi:peptide/nickel transport system permease protein
MTLAQKLAGALLATTVGAALMAGVVAPYPYEQQFREAVNAAPSVQFPLGTDELGRDRFSRLLYGMRVSLLLAPAAALVAALIAGVAGAAAGYLGGAFDQVFLQATDVFLSLPWLFLFLLVRALIPLNASPLVSAIATFALLGLLGWAGPARVARVAARSLRQADFVLQAKASGRRLSRLLLVDLLPNLRPVLLAQFWLSLPVFILAEANLGLLGLGVAEPLPSWGALLRELENYQSIGSRPWMLAPAVALVMVVGCLHLVMARTEASR